MRRIKTSTAVLIIVGAVIGMALVIWGIYMIDDVSAWMQRNAAH